MKILKFFEKIPNELIWEIFLFLESKDIYPCLLACRRFYEITLNEIFWKQVFVIYNIYYNILPFTTNKKNPQHSNIIIMLHSRSSDEIDIIEVLEHVKVFEGVKEIHIKHYTEEFFEKYGWIESGNECDCLNCGILNLNYTEIKKDFPNFKVDYIRSFIKPIASNEEVSEDITLILKISFIKENKGIKIFLNKNISKCYIIGFGFCENCIYNLNKRVEDLCGGFIDFKKKKLNLNCDCLKGWLKFENFILKNCDNEPLVHFIYKNNYIF